jgi:hypothetical protein
MGLYTPLGTRSNYRTIAYLHTLQITTAPAKYFFSLLSLSADPWQGILTVEILQLHALRFYLHNLTCRPQLSTDKSQLFGSPQLSSRLLLGSDHIEINPVSIVVIQLLQLPSNGLQNNVSNSNPIFVKECLLSRCVATALVSMCVTRSLSSNGSIRHSILIISTYSIALCYNCGIIYFLSPHFV